MTEGGARPGTDQMPRTTDDDWHRTQNTAGMHPGAVVSWFALMALLLGGFALMGASFADGNGVVFSAGLLVSGLAFVVPLAIRGGGQR